MNLELCISVVVTEARKKIRVRCYVLKHANLYNFTFCGIIISVIL